MNVWPEVPAPTTTPPMRRTMKSSSAVLSYGHTSTRTSSAAGNQSASASLQPGDRRRVGRELCVGIHRRPAVVHRDLVEVGARCGEPVHRGLGEVDEDRQAGARSHVPGVLERRRGRHTGNEGTRPRTGAHHHCSRLDELAVRLDVMRVEPIHADVLVHLGAGLRPQGREGAVGGDHRRSRLQHRVSPARERGEPLGDHGRGDALYGCAGGGERAEHRVGARPERELRGRVQQLHPGFGLECPPALRRLLRHCDEPRVGVPEPEDPCGSVRPAACVPDRVALEHQHLAPAPQRPCRRQPEEPAADDDDVGLLHCHAATITRAIAT